MYPCTYTAAIIGLCRSPTRFLLVTLLSCPAAALVAANPGLAKLLFALVFPVGLTMNTLHGTELFTGNTMKLPAAIYEGKTNMGGLIKNWFWSYSGMCVPCFLLSLAAMFTPCVGFVTSCG
jgi:formate/nitrite transporter FocA (FNT family)